MNSETFGKMQNCFLEHLTDQLWEVPRAYEVTTSMLGTRGAHAAQTASLQSSCRFTPLDACLWVKEHTLGMGLAIDLKPITLEQLTTTLVL